MNKNFKPVWGVLLIFIGVMTIVVLSRVFGPEEIVPWREDLSAAQAEARAANKPVLAYFTASWCGPCQSMKHTTWADRHVETALRDYVPVRIDIDAHQALSMRYGVEAVPTFAVLDHEGRVTKTTSGALRAKAFLEWLKG